MARGIGVRGWISFAVGVSVLAVGVPTWGADPAGGPSQAVLRKRYEAKLAAPWVAKGGWITSYERAKEQARKTGKLIFAYFSRSYLH